MAVVPEAALGLWKIKGRNPSSGRFKTGSLTDFVTTSFTPSQCKEEKGRHNDYPSPLYQIHY